MSRAHVCDGCNQVIATDEKFYIVGVYEPRPVLKSMFAFLEEREEQPTAEFCSAHCLVNRFIIAASVAGEVSL